METSTMPPKAQGLTAEEDALASQVLEIISGICHEALQALEEPEERDVWSVEEGDDSVFYSDEDQAHRDVEANTSCDAGANEQEHLVDSGAAGEPNPRREDDPGEKSIVEKSELKKEGTWQFVLTEQEDERQELQTAEAERIDQSDPADPGATPSLNSEKSESSLGEILQLNRTIADIQTQPRQSGSAEEANPPVEKEDVELKSQTPNLKHLDEKRYTGLYGEAEVPEQTSSAEVQTSGDRQLQVDRQPQKDRNFQAPVGFHQNPSPGYSTLPLPKKSGDSTSHQKSFNHLTSSKYSTVSYRKIRRGNTRQKIEEFEYMVMNL